jgi:hypothetical protein
MQLALVRPVRAGPEGGGRGPGLHVPPATRPGQQPRRARHQGRCLPAAAAARPRVRPAAGSTAGLGRKRGLRRRRRQLQWPAVACAPAAALVGLEASGQEEGVCGWPGACAACARGRPAPCQRACRCMGIVHGCAWLCMVHGHCRGVLLAGSAGRAQRCAQNCQATRRASCCVDRHKGLSREQNGSLRIAFGEQSIYRTGLLRALPK